MAHAKEAEHDRVEPGSDSRQDLARAPRDPGRRRGVADGRRTAPDHRTRLHGPASGGPGTAAARGPLGCRRPRRASRVQEDPRRDEAESQRPTRSLRGLDARRRPSTLPRGRWAAEGYRVVSDQVTGLSGPLVFRRLTRANEAEGPPPQAAAAPRIPRVVIDPDVLVRGLLRPRPSAALTVVELALEGVRLTGIVSPVLLEEVLALLSRPEMRRLTRPPL